MDITRTIQATENPSWVKQLFSGPPLQDWFPLPFTPRKAGAGNWLYVIYQSNDRRTLQAHQDSTVPEARSRR